MWNYKQATGELSHNGLPIGLGYAGCNAGKNNPDLQNVPNVGPLPCGLYTIGPAHLDNQTGPFSMRLTPDAQDNTYNRSDFYIHGDSLLHPGQASHGCIIFSRNIRLLIDASPDRRLEVVPR